MDTGTLFIKNMVCHRCTIMLETIIDKLQLPSANISMGQVVFSRPLTSCQEMHLDEQLQAVGFEVITDKREQLVDAIKRAVMDYVNQGLIEQKLSEYLSLKLGYEYRYLGREFATCEGQGIERFVIAYKIERVKELMFVDKLSLTEIAYELNYSSLAHMSAQFKKSTGYSPGHYRQKKCIKSRIPHDQLKII